MSENVVIDCMTDSFKSRREVGYSSVEYSSVRSGTPSNEVSKVYDSHLLLLERQPKVLRRHQDTNIRCPFYKRRYIHK